MSETAETKAPYSASQVFTQVFSGLGIGLLVGIIVGLSVSPVVSIILGSLAALLAAFMGLQDGGAAEPANPNFLSRLNMSGLRMGSFGFACVAGILFGLFIRSHDLLSIPVERQVEKWTKAGYKVEEARQFVAFQKLGVKPAAKEIIAGNIQKAGSSNLYAGLSQIDLCYEISLARYGDDASEVLKAYRRQENEKLTRLADQIERLPGDEQKHVLKAVEEVLCELQTLSSK